MSEPNTFYVTTPIYYVNDVPHIGHAYTTIAADVLARYWRLKGRDVLFLTGLDEHGQKVQQAAAKAGIDPQAHCDALAPQFQHLWQRLNISNDAFIRTTDRRHKQVVQRCLQQLFDKHLIYKSDYSGWYCTFDERFWTEKDLADGLCPDCRRPVERLSEHNYFFKMGQYQAQLLRHIQEHPEFIRPESRRNEVLGFLTTQTLGDLSISRPKARLSWGIELPFDKDYVTYVWFDALVNYVSALEYLPPGNPAGRCFWPANIHLVGKDILTTHAVYWSTMLMALDLPLPQTIFAHGWWTVDGEKMSKSRGNVVDPNKMVDQFGVDAFRYFLLREVPFGQDGDFSHAGMVTRINSELAGGLGNLLSRSLTMIDRFAGGIVPSHDPAVDTPLEHNLMQRTGELLADADKHVEQLRFSRALESIGEILQLCDQYIDKTAPWALAKKPEQRPYLNNCLYHLAHTLGLLIRPLYPFIPSTIVNMARQLGMDPQPRQGSSAWKDPSLLPGTKIQKAGLLFPRIEMTTLQGDKPVSDGSATPQPATPLPSTTTTPTPPAPAAPPQITIDEFSKIQLKTATVLSAERVPKSEKLVKLQVDLGHERRQIVAGIGKKYDPSDLVGKTIVIVANLKPAKLMGIESQGMVLAAGDTDVQGLVTVLEPVAPGTKVK
ncbi:methionine--tRNA ligase [Candidatus Nitrospira inopinata]|jgi:methionyl-tRNA synthetase|uniref:Methionine--tRNA ligase n=1 Tax=Candidatus Nitrospira inopinata TaxID=1715989 RepID=A0A0S4KXQ8_9BACT|nr:methionine--tRNA ligase [Candidatus Nitrospira inopinata]CUQ67334.1 Methionine--tRNA ligase [Candidatus Nitrospira inopinata]